MSRTKPRGASEAKPRQNRARRMGEILPEVGGMAFRRFGFVQSSVVSRWHEIVGDRYAHVSAPESIRFPHGKRADGVLTLTVTPAHAPMMQHVVPVIIERVNRFFGYAAVARVSIRQGEMVRAAKAPARRELPPVPVDLGDSLRTVADPELKAVLESLARGLGTPDVGIPVIGKVR